MNVDNVLTTNKVYLTGKIVNTKGLSKMEGGELVPNIRTSSKGDNYISGSITLEIEEGVNIEVEFYSKETTKDNKPSKLFKEYCNLPNRIGERVTLGQAQFTENRFWGQNDQIISLNRISARFINPAKEDRENQAEFTFDGYVESPIKERLNKDKELLYYEMTLAQANWNGEKPIYIKFIVPPQEEERFEAIQRIYTKGLTVSITGDIQVVRTQTVVPAKETAFGKQEDKVYDNEWTYFVVQTGLDPLDLDDEGAYQPADIRELTEAYNAESVSIEAAAKESSQQGNSVIKNVKKAGTKRQALV